MRIRKMKNLNCEREMFKRRKRECCGSEFDIRFKVNQIGIFSYAAINWNVNWNLNF